MNSAGDGSKTYGELSVSLTKFMRATGLFFFLFSFRVTFFWGGDGFFSRARFQCVSVLHDLGTRFYKVSMFPIQ